eukprot:4142506-Amphidinium_carterae.1
MDCYATLNPHGNYGSDDSDVHHYGSQDQNENESNERHCGSDEMRRVEVTGSATRGDNNETTNSNHASEAVSAGH